MRCVECGGGGRDAWDRTYDARCRGCGRSGLAYRPTYADALRSARAAWPDGDGDETGEAAAAAMDAREAAAYGDDDDDNDDAR